MKRIIALEWGSELWKKEQIRLQIYGARDGGTTQQECPVVTVEGPVPGEVPQTKFYEGGDLACLVVTPTMGHKVSA